MTHDEFAAWLEGYRNAWESRNPDAAVLLFSEDATYQETPFDIPMQGAVEIWEYWAEVPKIQDEVKFKWTILAITENLGIAHWQAQFKRIPSGMQVNLDGILAAEFEDSKHCRTFREWWHRKEV